MSLLCLYMLCCFSFTSNFVFVVSLWRTTTLLRQLTGTTTPLQGPGYCPLLLCLFVSLRIWWFSSQSFFLFPPQFGFPMSLPSLDYLSCKISPSQKANYKHPLFVFLFFFFFSFLFILFWVMEACCCNLEVDVNGEETLNSCHANSAYGSRF